MIVVDVDGNVKTIFIVARSRYELVSFTQRDLALLRARRRLAILLSSLARLERKLSPALIRWGSAVAGRRHECGARRAWVERLGLAGCRHFVSARRKTNSLGSQAALVYPCDRRRRRGRRGACLEAFGHHGLWSASNGFDHALGHSRQGKFFVAGVGKDLVAIKIMAPSQGVACAHVGALS